MKGERPAPLGELPRGHRDFERPARFDTNAVVGGDAIGSRRGATAQQAANGRVADDDGVVQRQRVAETDVSAAALGVAAAAAGAENARMNIAQGASREAKRPTRSACRHFRRCATLDASEPENVTVLTP